MKRLLLLVALLTLCLPVDTQARCVQPPSGMTAWWRAENNPYDSADGMHGTMMNGASYAAGFVGQAFSLDGTNDYVDLPDGFADFTSGFTAVLWAYPTASNYWARFFDFANGEGQSNILLAREQTTNNLVFEVYNSSHISGGKVIASNAIDNNAWHLYAVTEDSGGNVTLYKDGQAIQTGTTMVPENLTRTANYIGRSNWAIDGYYGGSIDELTIYNRVLTANEILAIYNAGSDGICTDYSVPAMTPWGVVVFILLAGLVAAWRLRLRQSRR